MLHTNSVSFLTAIFVNNIFRSNTYFGSWCHFRISQSNEVAEEVVRFFILTDRRTDEAILTGIPKGREALQRMLGMAAHC